MGPFQYAQLALIGLPPIIWLIGSHPVRAVTAVSLLAIGFWFALGHDVKSFGTCIGCEGAMLLLLQYAALDREARLKKPQQSCMNIPADEA